MRYEPSIFQPRHAQPEPRETYRRLAAYPVAFLCRNLRGIRRGHRERTDCPTKFVGPANKRCSTLPVKTDPVQEAKCCAGLRCTFGSVLGRQIEDLCNPAHRDIKTTANLWWSPAPL